MLQYFTLITKDEFTTQKIVTSFASASSLSSSCNKKRKAPGRPRKPVPLDEVLKYNNHTNNNNNNNSKNTDKVRRIDWFKTEFIYDILESYKLNRSGFLVVKDLQNRFPSNRFNRRFDKLSESTIDGWFNLQTHELKPEYAEKLTPNYEPNRQLNNRIGALDKYPEVKKAILDRLKQLRLAGGAMRIRNIRIVIIAIVKHMCSDAPEIKKLRFCKSFICNFVRDNLQWKTRESLEQSGDDARILS